MRLIGECRRLAGGSAAGGNVVHALHYWSSRMTVEHEGHMWRALPAKEWVEELGFGSESAFWRTIEKLISLGVVAKIVRHYNHIPTLHMRLVNPVRVPPDNGHKEVRKNAYPVDKSANLDIYTTGPTGHSSMRGKKRTKNADEAVSKFTDPEVEDVIVARPSGVDLEKLWVAAMRLWNPKVSTITWTDAEKKMAMSIIKRCPDPVETQRAIAYAIENWEDFRKYASTQTAWFNPPQRPSLTLLTKHPDVMLDFRIEHENEAAERGDLREFS